MSDRERVEAEARERYPADDVTVAGIHMGDLMENCQTAFIVGRTITTGQAEFVAEVLAEVTGEPQPGRFERTMARAALAAAGLLIEGDRP